MGSETRKPGGAGIFETENRIFANFLENTRLFCTKFAE